MRPSSKAKLIPYAIAAGAIALVCLLQSLRHGSTAGRTLEELEWKTFDWRVRVALKHEPPCATNLGFVSIGDDDIKRVADGSGGQLDYRYGLYWPRDVYGHLVDELKAQGAKWIAFDVVFGELRFDHQPIIVASNQPPVSPDEFFADRLRAAGNVCLATSDDLLPNRLFRDAAGRMGDISTARDSDGVLRRARAFHDKRIYHSVIERTAQQEDFRLDQIQVHPGREIVLVRESQKISIPLSTNNQFDIAEFRRHFVTEKGPAASRGSGLAYREPRVWHTGIVMAAAQLGLDLDMAEVNLAAGYIHLPGTNGVSRRVPVDSQGFFHVDWSILPNDRRLTHETISSLLLSERSRRLGQTNGIAEIWRNKILIIGSTATGNDLTDKGANPIQNDAFLVGKHWNVANAVIMDRFITRSPLWVELLIVTVLGIASAALTIKLPPPRPTPAVLLLAGAYVWFAVHLYVTNRTWLPMFLPVVGALGLTHVALVTYQSVFEQREKRRVRDRFAKLVSPNIVNELLQQQELRVGGRRERITVFFADVRGFTTLTDVNQARAEKYVSDHQLTGAAAEAHFDEVAAETLATVNLYLAAIADQIKKHNGTLDKYIGDCVMAFWGAPTPNEQHAVACVRAAVDAQIAMHLINEERARENQRREADNVRRLAAGEEPQHLLALLALGTGINTGTAIVGMMGSEAHISNYTIFGRDVNLASRLEGVSGHSRIIIGETTLQDLEKFAPDLARQCVELPAVKVKGIASEVRIWEVPWKNFLPQTSLPPAAPAQAA